MAELTPAFFVVCALLVIAGCRKVLTAEGARESLALVGVSAPSLAIRGLGAAEVALGTLAIVSPSLVAAALVALSYGAFCGFVLALLARNRSGSVDCGCFGGGEYTAGGLHVALNAAACVIAAASALIGAHGLGWILGRSALVAPAVVIGMLAATYAAYLAYTLVPRAWGSYGTGTAR